MLRARPAITPLAVLAGFAALAYALALHAGRGTYFWFDEWLWITDRRPWTAATFLEPHNEHLSLVPLVLYKALFATVGIDHYWVYRVALLATNALCAWLVFCLVRRRLGAWEGAIGAGLLLVLGRSFDNLIWPFQTTYQLSIAAALGALLALDRRSRRGDLAAAGLLGASIASAGLGLPFALGIGVEMAWARELRARWWVLAAPLAAYAAWYAGYGHGSLRYEPERAPGWALDAASAAFGALLGQGRAWGLPLLVAAAAGLAVVALRRRVTPRLAGILAAGVSFWLLTGTTRAFIQDPETSRYLYLGVVVIVLAAAEALRDVPRPRAALAAAGAAVVASAVLNAGPLEDGGRLLRGSAERLRAQLGALELARDAVRPDVVPSYGIVTAGDYLAAFAAFGQSPALSPAELLAAPPDARALADRMLQDGGAVRARPVAGPRCGAPVGELTVAPGERLLLAGPPGTPVLVRRYGDAFANPPAATMAPGRGLMVVLRRDRGPGAWHLRAPGARLCPSR